MEISSALDRTKLIESTVSAKLSEFEKRSVESSNQQTADFSSAQSKRQAEFSDLLSQVRTEVDKNTKAMFAEIEEEIDTKQNETDDLLGKLVDDAKEKHNSILQLFQLSAKDSVSGGHQSIADREYKSAEFWRRVTVGSAIVAISWVLISYFFFTPGDESDRVFWIRIAKSVSITALLISVSVYASKQSTLHRFNERRARAFSLQVQAFDPFIASLPDDMRNKLKEEISRRIFASEDQEIQALLKNVDFESLDKASFLAQLIPLLTGKK